MSVDEFPVDVLVLGHVVDLAEGEDNDISGLFTSLLVLGRGHVGVDGLNVTLDGGPVGHDVLDDLGESGWGNELLAPVLDLGDITLDVLAVREVLWELLDELDGILDTLDEVLHVSLGHLVDDFLDLSGDDLGVLEALLHLWKVILLDEAVDDTSELFLDTADVGEGVIVLGGGGVAE